MEVDYLMEDIDSSIKVSWDKEKVLDETYSNYVVPHEMIIIIIIISWNKRCLEVF